MHTTVQAVNYGVGTNPYSFAVADLNKDDYLDIVIANCGANTVSLLFGNPAGTFFPAPNSPYAVGAGPHSVATGDLNKDSYLDIVTANFNANSVSVLLGNVAGTFAPAPNSPYAVGTSPISVAIGDLNKDGYPDIVTANFGDHTVSVLFINSVGTFSTAPNFPYAVGTKPRSVAIVDLNKDSYLDIVVVNEGASSVSVLLGSFSKTFSKSPNSPYSVGTNPRAC